MMQAPAAPSSTAGALMGASSTSSDALMSSVSLRHRVARARCSRSLARSHSHRILSRSSSMDAAAALLVLKNGHPVKRVRFSLSEHRKTVDMKNSAGRAPTLRRSVSVKAPAATKRVRFEMPDVAAAATKQQQELRAKRVGTANVVGKLWAQPIEIIVDTGANQTVISQRVVQQLGMQHLVQPMSVMMKVACGGSVASLGRISVPVTIAGTTMEIAAYVSASTTYNMLLGMDWLAVQGCVIDLSRKVVTVGMQRSTPLLL